MLAGDVVEMATGEGKTLAGAIAAAGYAIGGRNVHVITINDYLARRDAEWMGPLLEAMGLTVGWITAESTAEERRDAYKCNITYASVNEIGFDVLRDQLVTDVADLVSPNPDVALDRRGRLGAGRRGAGAAGAGRHHAPREAAPGDHPAGRRADPGQGLRHRRRQPQRPPDRGGRAEAGGQARRDRPVLRGACRHHTDRGQRRAARPCAAAARHSLHRPRRRGAPDQRLPRSHRPAAALAGRPAGRRRGERGHRDHRDRRGARHHHRAGTDQPISDGVRHDRHRAGGRRAAAAVLQAGCLANPAEYSQHSRRRVRPGVHHRGRQDRRNRRAHRRGARDRPAGAGRHP